MLPRKQICMPYSKLKNFMITQYKHKGMGPREGEELFNWKGSLGIWTNAYKPSRNTFGL